MSRRDPVRLQHIVIAANVPPEQQAGVANVVRAHIAALRRALPGATVVHVPGPASFVGYQWRTLRWLLAQRRRPDAVIAHGSDGLLLLLAGRVLGVPVLINLWHGLAPTLERVMRRAGLPGEVPRRQLLTAWLSLRLARRRLVMSRADRLWLRLAWRLSAEVIGLGGAEGVAEPEVAAGVAPALAFVGFPSRRKGFDRFVVLSLGATRCVQVGARIWDGDWGRVEALGGLRHEEVLDFLRRTPCVVVVPSRFEGNPAAVQEAVACGRPVVATGWGGQRDFLRGTGWYVRRPDDLNSAISAILQDPASAAARARALRSRLQTWDEAARPLWRGPA